MPDTFTWNSTLFPSVTVMSSGNDLMNGLLVTKDNSVNKNRTCEFTIRVCLNDSYNSHKLFTIQHVFIFISQ